MSGWKEVPEADGSSHVELALGAETLGKLQTVPVKEEAAWLPMGRERCRELGVPSKDGFWKFSVVKKNCEAENSLSEESRYLKVAALRRTVIPTHWR